MAIIRLDQQKRRLKFETFELDNEITFSYFEKVPVDQRDDTLFRAIYIGVLALMEDRLAAFLARTQSELGTQLESLKIIFEMRREIFLKSPAKGVAGEEEIAEILSAYFKKARLKDTAHLTGSTPGLIHRNKTGDIVCFLDGDESKKIAIECKFDKSIRLGDLSDRDPFARGADSAWSQLIEAQVNRGSIVSLIVFDKSSVDKSLEDYVENLKYVPNIGFIAIIDIEKGDFKNLLVAYSLARDIALNTKQLKLDPSILELLVKRLIRDLDVFVNIRTLVERNIESNKEILKQLQKSFLMIEFCQQYLTKFLQDGYLTHDDLLAFYKADEIKDKYKIIEASLFND